MNGRLLKPGPREPRLVRFARDFRRWLDTRRIDGIGQDSHYNLESAHDATPDVQAQRIAVAADVLRSISPDIILLQEVRDYEACVREATEISARKKSIVGILRNVAELGAGRMEETIGKASLRDAAIGTGIAVDKMLALDGQSPIGIQIANIAMPSEEEREARRAIDRRLDEIARRLRELPAAG